ncbi:MAG: twin-arginine translocation signal domain-containing protein [Lachnospiraceae bacterium]|nr:twin-arginine translocation signal domain-containing protein [Lachnospiraceae bacterium]
MMNKISRRDFLKGTAASAATVALSTVFFSAPGWKALAAEDAEACAGTQFYCWLNGEPDTGLMASYWFPDAGAGYDADGDGVGDYVYQVEEMVADMVEAGFSGCELTMLIDTTDFGMLSDEEYAELGFTDAEDAMSKIGWGTDAWSNIIACATDTANRYNSEEGTNFKVDVTITAHWPMIINNVGPNDDEQQQDLVYTIQKVTADELENGVTLQLPEMKTSDYANSSNMQSTFIFKDTLVSSTLATYAGEQTTTSMDAWSGEEVTTSYAAYDYTSLTDVTDAVSSVDGYEAGVPKADALYMRLAKDEEAGTYEWIYYSAIGEVNEAYSLAEDYIVLEAGTEKIYAGNLSVSAMTSFGMTTYTVTDQDTGEVLEDGSYDIIDAGTVVSLYEDADGNSCATILTEENAEDLVGLITVSNRHFLGDREEMSDIQELYSISGENLSGLLSDEAAEKISASEGEDLAEGDYVLINVYRRGTGQVASGGSNICMTNKTYAVDYFCSEGAQKVIDYWEETIFPHVYTRSDGTTSTVKEIMEENGAAIFEDSIELNHGDGNLWSVNLGSEIEARTGLDVMKYMPVIAGVTFVNDDGEADRVTEDYKETLNETYAEYHLGTISAWTNTFGYKFRTQAHGIDAVDAGTAALSTDIAESDNATDGFGTRVYAGVKNVNPNNNVISNESLTFGTGFGQYPSWYYCINTLNRYYSEGVNRVILHGTPFKSSYTRTSTASSNWPGWDFLNQFMAWNSRQTWWDDVEVFTRYIDRVQAILQDGTSKIPVALLEDPTVSNVTQINSGVGVSKAMLQQLIGEGYNYNIITRGLLESENASLDIVTASLSGETVLSELAEFQIIVLDHITCMSIEAMEKLLSYAEAGLKIVNIGSDITTIYGTDGDGSADAQVQTLFEELKACATYAEITSDDEAEIDEDGMTQAEIDLISYIKENVDSGISYADAVSSATNDKGSKWLEATRIYDPADGTNYYLLYNESGVSVGAEQDASFGPASWEENGDITVTATFAGSGVPYILDPADGSVKAVKNYTAEDGRVTIDLSIQEGDLIFVAVSDSEDFSANAAEQITDEEKTVQTTIALGGDQTWNLTLNSYSADETDENLNEKGQMIDPTKSIITTIDVETPLTAWMNLELTSDELAALGIETAAAISGTGVYSIDVDIEKYDGAAIGAVLNYTYNVEYNNITCVTVTNSEGTTTELTGINPNHQYLDLGTVLTAGTNTITVKVCGDLTNRVNNGASPSPSENGLTDASLKVYTVA